MLEERYPDLDEEEYIIMMDSREEHWRDVDEDDEDRSMINYLRWDVYTKDKEKLIKRDFLVTVMHLKGGNIFWTYVKDNIIKYTEDYKAIGLHGFDYKLFV